MLCDLNLELLSGPFLDISIFMPSLNIFTVFFTFHMINILDS